MDCIVDNARRATAVQLDTARSRVKNALHRSQIEIIEAIRTSSQEVDALVEQAVERLLADQEREATALDKVVDEALGLVS